MTESIETYPETLLWHIVIILEISHTSQIFLIISKMPLSPEKALFHCSKTNISGIDFECISFSMSALKFKKHVKTIMTALNW